MTETIRYSKLYQEDLALGTGTDEVTLADGRVVSLTRLNGDTLATQSPSASQIKVLYDDRPYDASYSSLAAALTAIGTNKAHLLLAGDVAVVGNTTIPSNVVTDYAGAGMFTGTDTLTINGVFHAARQQKFATTLNPDFTSNTVMRSFLPEWWGALADSSTDNQSAFDRMLADLPSDGAAVSLAAGRYDFASVFIIDRDDVTFIGAGRLATLLYASGSNNLLQMGDTGVQAAHIIFRDMGFNNGASGGDLIDVTGGGCALCRWENTYVKQTNPDKSLVLLDNESGTNFIENKVDGGLWEHVADNTVPSVYLRSPENRINGNSWKNMRCHGRLSGEYFFHLEITANSKFAQDNTFVDISGEQNIGGFLYSGGTARLRMENVTFYDITTTTKDLVKLDVGATTNKTRSVTFINVSRAGGSLGSGLEDIHMVASGVDTAVIMNCDTTSGSGFTVECNDNLGVVVINPRGGTYNNVGNNGILFGYDSSDGPTLEFGEDTRLYRGGADLIQTDDAFYAAGAYLRVPSKADATRGAAGTAGRIVFNTDDGNLNIDDGTNWILPDGTTT